MVGRARRAPDACEPEPACHSRWAIQGVFFMLTVQSKLVGFFDPCIGEKKSLFIRYVFRGHLHEVVVADLDAVALPMRSQQL